MKKPIIYLLIAATMLSTSCANYKAARQRFKEKRVEWKVEDEQIIKRKTVEKYKRKKARLEEKQKVHPIGWLAIGAFIVAVFVIADND